MLKRSLCYPQLFWIFSQHMNKRPTSHLRKQFQSINTFAESYSDYIIKLIKRKRHFLLFEHYIWPLFVSVESPSPMDTFWQVWMKSVPWFRRKLLNFVDVFLLFSYYLPSKKGVALHLNKLEFSSPKNDLCQVWILIVWLIDWIVFYVVSAIWLKMAWWFWRKGW